MELVLRKRASGELLRLNGAKVLCNRSRKLALLAPYPAQWVFHALAAAESVRLCYNRLPAPPRCSVAAGDLLDFDGLELVVESVQLDTGEFPLAVRPPDRCEIEVTGEGCIEVVGDVLLGYDSCLGLCRAATLDGQPLTALLAFASGRWHLHDLNGKPLLHNGKRTRASLVLADGDRVCLENKEVFFHIGRPFVASAAAVPRQTKAMRVAPAKETVEIAALAAAPPVDAVYEKAKDLCQRLLPRLRDGRAFFAQTPSCRGIRGWLRLLRRPQSAIETLERLEFFLSASPRHRVWLYELARFLYEQSYVGLCLRVMKELCRLYPDDGERLQTLAKFYYRQGRNARLPLPGRLNALEQAEKCTRVCQRLAPSDTLVTDLQRAVSAAQTKLQKRSAVRGGRR